MASLLFKEMKGLNFSCTSPASTAAICATIEGSSLISSGAGRAIDRYNPHLRDPRRTKPVKPPALLPPQIPPSSKTKKKKKTNNKSSEKSNSANFVTINNNTSASPGSSTRFLLNSDATLSHDHVFAEPEFLSVSSPDKDHEPSSSSSSSSSIVTTVTSSTSAASSVSVTDADASGESGDHAVVKPENQVVVLRVSLHCKGCEGKVRKHISKMEGVKSFLIDFAAKKVTVIGDVTPLGVLNSISKVKSAQFWPSPGDSSS
ncbi:Copper chaperone domain-containing protein [Dioscorea alata]|uniref:Copper chaperone domain-containing protein n=1 Tax=Dioscorea alata TaxID=55571 RepID=A0ACB7U970_DIOAL|nr:Copper chaperone domain-containing protein [Dioscorea alata]